MYSKQYLYHTFAQPYNQMTMQNITNYNHSNKDRYLDELIALLRIPSISAKSEHKEDMILCADMVREKLVEAGVDKAVIYTTPGHPIVYAEKIVDPSWPTVLVYGHYDVQPADPLELWDSPPFEPVIKNDRVYAIGGCDE